MSKRYVACNMYNAHVNNDKAQSVTSHLNNVAGLARDFASKFGYEGCAYNAGLLHDIGKCSEEFQLRLKGGPKVDHSTAGAHEAFIRKLIIEAFCIAGHHSGLPDYGSKTQVGGHTLCARLNRAKNGEIPQYSDWGEYIQFIPERYPIPKELLDMYYATKMVYSCLTDADYLDTEKFMKGEIDRSRKLDVDYALNSLSQYIADKKYENNKLNAMRKKIFNHVTAEGKKRDKGIFTLSVPCGGGKTLTSLSFALEHAKRNGMDRIIYVIPYTSIIDQTADIYREILADDYVLEHHSYVDRNADELSMCQIKATENWDMPIIVTTGVQFFESFYKNKPSSSRKLHNIANSVIIFDEAQMLPVDYMRPCVALLSHLVNNYNASVVLCTATQPSLNALLQEYGYKHEIAELCPEEYYTDPVFRRVIYRNDGCFDITTLADKINTNKQCLCIVNTRSTAKKLYKSIKIEDGCYHLSADMYPAHRKKIIAEIKARLDAGLTCKVISTSLVEAGVDVDFPCVYRELAGLDSINQAAGRCNREGGNPIEESVVHIFTLDGQSAMFSQQIAAARYAMQRYDDISSKAAIKAYYDTLFYLAGTGLDKKDIITKIVKEMLSFKTVSDCFEFIANDGRTLYVRTADNKDKITALLNGTIKKQDLRQLYPYSINIYDNKYNKLHDMGAIKTLDNGDCVLLDYSLYDDDMGLNID